VLQQEQAASWHALVWLRDAHWRLAMGLAMPVWLGLGLWVGDGMRAPAGWQAWLSLVLIQPLLEEAVFRGLLQGELLQRCRRHGRPLRLGPLTLANTLVTLLFVALHLRVQPLFWALAVAGPSLLLGHLRERLGSVWPGVLAHGWFNLGFACTAWLAQSPRGH
jgi:membrane protease YdiL (CAAX protease family)